MNKEKALSRMRAALRQAMILAADYDVDISIYVSKVEGGGEGGAIRIGDWEMWNLPETGGELRYQPLSEDGDPTRTGEWDGPVADARFNGFQNPPKNEDALQTAK